ncbi:uracil-DNA glycosylase [Janthinobacterium psychrotolerans]|uniref:Uracil-DNA glycosylase n=1 Tax=Janthinobacterium psychrotolerans TaxID=1747903 RepID=A0A1A7C687_9BURK|nr:uracil-DNA glycosylase [Janthinobacterium psychrotolerans]OBV41227.1 uracil-DNA glycosylase [Janthinobacterium psychrotolerans]
MEVRIEASWKQRLHAEFEQPWWTSLVAFVKEEYAAGPCFPPGKAIFRAFDLAPFEQVKVVILGQDPYHTPGAAMGLCFSIPDGTRAQPSLQNIFKELKSDVGVARTSTDLSDWAEQGVFLLNSVLTVRSGAAGSHAGKGWEKLTDSAIRHLSQEREGVVFILWGAYAIAKRALIDEGKHLVLTAPHPSPLSAHRGFFGSKPFSQANAYLQENGKQPINWG